MTHTPRERRTLELRARGLENAQIAAWPKLADKTVRNHITGVFSNIGAGNRPQTILRARDAGFGTAGMPAAGPASRSGRTDRR